MGTWEVYSEKKKCSTLGKKSRFGHTSFIKVVINGTITNNRSKTPHDSIENTVWNSDLDVLLSGPNS